MSKLQTILRQAKAGFAPGQRIPQAEWPRIAAQCGPAEIAQIHERIASLQAELAGVPEWDGDTQDDIRLAIAFFNGLLRLANGGRP